MSRSKRTSYLAAHNWAKIPSKDRQPIKKLKSDCALFSRSYIACQTRDGNLDKFFEHENQGCPSLSHHGSVGLVGNKSDLLECNCKEAVISATTDFPNSAYITIIDGAAAIDLLQNCKGS